MMTIYSFKIEGVSGEVIDFAQFSGKKILLVNVASECGFTNQYAQLQELHEYYKDSLVIVGFPCNDFGNQEPLDNQGIKEFCTINYQVSFPVTTKINILSNRHEIYNWLCQKGLNGVADSEVLWNFQKYLVDEKGHLVKMFPSSVSPLDESLITLISS